jgi:hypothetical protein
VNSITQRHTYGCAVACVAFILNKSYDEALELFSQSSDAWTKGFYCFEVVAALKRGGKEFYFAEFDESSHKAYSTPHIVFISSLKYPAGHYLVKVEENKWMDSWINFPVIDPTKSGYISDLPGNSEWVILNKRETLPKNQSGDTDEQKCCLT